MRNLWPGCLFLVTAVLSETCQAQSPAGSPIDPEWRLVANSTLILRARMDVPVEKIEETIKTGKESFVTLRFDVLETLKGKKGLKSVEAVYRSGAESYNPAPKAVLALNGKEVLVFISDKYIVQEKQTIRPFEQDKLEQLRKEIANQRFINKNFAQLPVGCAFAPRCPMKIEKCATEPALLPVAQDHAAACWRSAEVEKLPNGTLLAEAA